MLLRTFPREDSAGFVDDSPSQTKYTRSSCPSNAVKRLLVRAPRGTRLLGTRELLHGNCAGGRARGGLPRGAERSQGGSHGGVKTFTVGS